VCSAEAERLAQIQYTRGTRYLGAPFGAEAENVVRQVQKVEQWTEAVTTLVNTAFYGLAVILQNEWMHVGRTVLVAGAHVVPVKTA